MTAPQSIVSLIRKFTAAAGRRIPVTCPSEVRLRILLASKEVLHRCKTLKMKRRTTRFAIAAAWIAVIAIAYATLTHVGFVYAIYFKLAPYLMRPAMQTYAHFEHVIAFACLGVLFCFAYPRRPILVCVHRFRRRSGAGDHANPDARPARHMDRCAGENGGRRGGHHICDDRAAFMVGKGSPVLRPNSSIRVRIHSADASSRTASIGRGFKLS